MAMTLEDDGELHLLNPHSCGPPAAPGSGAPSFFLQVLASLASGTLGPLSLLLL